MRRRFRGFFIASLVIVGLCGPMVALGMGDRFLSGAWRYKMTVSVETPEGLKTGSAIREVHVRRPFMEFPNVTSSVTVKGEAVAVDLGQRRILFALLSGYKAGPDHSYMVVFNGLPIKAGGTSPEGIRHYRNLKDAKATLTPTDYPVLVMFKDIKDPKTVTPVLEMESDHNWPPIFTVKADHFEELFGKGVKLKEITIEMTDEKVTWGIEEYIQKFGGSAGPFDKSVFIKKGN